ncbi:GGDEF domain-containing protein [Vogesella sp. DC21W]|uniref:diguanylate cyclase n=1 Tax=Vogesella aquatica TaxID=2984206 RepID=A0ABT5IW82_9NEIS|nr:GGDEF domain-containing protein [Vogesella aquatica]MDC7716433.1 GGDEF domain-containing protein [Vogesella aquatica]
MDQHAQPSSIATLMEQMAKMTSQREQRELERALLELVSAFLQSDSIALYGVRYAESLPELKLLQVAEKDSQISPDSCGWLPAGDDARKAIAIGRDHRAPWEYGGHIWQVIYQKNNIIALLQIEHGPLTPDELGFLSGMVRIHENYLRLLYDAERDMLTGLLNRRSFDARLYELLDNPDYQHTLALVDIDHFKLVNDRYGHIVGDEVLLLVAHHMEQVLGAHAQLYRYGGEEFGIILRDEPQLAMTRLEALRENIASFNFPQVGAVKISMGYVLIGGQMLPANVVEQADRALYYAKENGRNQTCAYTQLLQRGEIAAQIPYEGDIELF